MSDTPSSKQQRRPIRSFVRRAGRMTRSQQQALDDLWPEYAIELRGGPIDFAAVFDRNAATALEIGFGNGESLVRQAAANPAMNFVGIEVHDPGIGHCLIAMRKVGIDNLRLIAGDAIEVLQTAIPPRSLSRINLYFPDPWPKKRHHKRRIVQQVFLSLCAERLQQGGTLHIATDWQDYAEHIDAVFAADTLFSCEERREHAGDQPLDRPGTKFERRGLKKGHRIWDWRFSTK